MIAFERESAKAQRLGHPVPLAPPLRRREHVLQVHVLGHRVVDAVMGAVASELRVVEEPPRAPDHAPPTDKHRLSQRLHRLGERRRTGQHLLRDAGQLGAERRERRVSHRADEALKLGLDLERRCADEHRPDLDGLHLVAWDDALLAVTVVGGRLEVDDQVVLDRPELAPAHSFSASPASSIARTRDLAFSSSVSPSTCMSISFMRRAWSTAQSMYSESVRFSCPKASACMASAICLAVPSSTRPSAIIRILISSPPCVGSRWSSRRWGCGFALG